MSSSPPAVAPLPFFFAASGALLVQCADAHHLLPRFLARAGDGKGMGTSGKTWKKGGKNIAIQASLQEYVNEEINQNMDLNGSGHQQIIRKWVSGMNIPLKSETYQSTSGISTMKMSWKHGNGQELITIRWWFLWSSVDDQVWITTTTGQASSRCFFVLAKCPRKIALEKVISAVFYEKKTHMWWSFHLGTAWWNGNLIDDDCHQYMTAYGFFKFNPFWHNHPRVRSGTSSLSHSMPNADQCQCPDPNESPTLW